MSPSLDVSRATEVARDAALAAGAAALARWRRLDSVEVKADGSPVTVADREAEEAAVAVIRSAFPDHDVLGEEGGLRGRGGRLRWIVDPIDGTRGYARGGFLWGSLIALEVGGDVVAGAMALPVLRAVYWAGRGLGCFRDGRRVTIPAAVAWRDAVVSLGGVHRLLVEHPRATRIEALVRSASAVRAYGDLGACAMLLDGTADAWIEAGVKVWDVAAPRVLVEEAGGRFTDLAGRETHETGEALAARPALHAEALAVLAS